VCWGLEMHVEIKTWTERGGAEGYATRSLYKKGGDEHEGRGNGERRGRDGGMRGWTVGSGVNSVIIVISPS